MLSAEILTHCAKAACKAAPARELHQGNRQIAFAGVQIAPRANVTGLCNAGRTVVAPPQPPGANIGKHLSPTRFGIANKNTVGVHGRLFRQQRDMHSAQNDRHAPQPEFCGNLVRPPRGIGFDSDGDKIGRLIVRNRLHPVIVQNNLDIRRRQTGEHAQHQRLHTPFIDIQAMFVATDCRLDQGNFHTFS